MGHLVFGRLHKIRGIIYYRLSPYELNPVKGFVSNGIISLCRKFYNNFVFILPPTCMSYVVYDHTTSENERLSRKNPADYENDV